MIGYYFVTPSAGFVSYSIFLNMFFFVLYDFTLAYQVNAQSNKKYAYHHSPVVKRYAER